MDVTFDNVTVELGGWPVCDDVSIDIPAGSFTVVVGPNGAGKSSLLRCLYRALRPAAGTVMAGGDDVWTLPGSEAGRRTAAVVQESTAGFDLKVREIVSLGRIPHRRVWQRLEATDRDVIDEAIAQVGLEALAERSIATLSGGERQRALIARAIAQRAAVLVLDEPTNHLDVRHQLETLELVRTLGVTTLAALHDIGLADRYADQVVLLDSGRVVAAGPPSVTLTVASINEVFGLDAEFLAPTSADQPRAIVLALARRPGGS